MDGLALWPAGSFGPSRRGLLGGQLVAVLASGVLAFAGPHPAAVRYLFYEDAERFNHKLAAFSPFTNSRKASS